MKRIAFIVVFLWWGVLHAQPPRSYTSSEILLQLKKLNTVGSVLYIAAHPDDENTRLIAYLANEKCLRTGYLSLTRGDGGQNLIGPEQGVELGVIRTQELLAARRIDGGEQFFTRAYDFGYSKTPEETFKKWSKDSVLSDVVWVIRNFRPDIIITRFATDGSGGHGHHTASAILAEEAFDAAGDPKRFPEQLQYVDVWQPRRLFYNATNRFRDPNADMSAFIKLDVGGYNPLLGKSYGEIAAESRSMHKSQGFGSAKQRGEYFEYFKPVKGDTAGLKDIFEGIDFTWKRVKGGDKIGKKIEISIKNYSSHQPSLCINRLFKIVPLMTSQIKKGGDFYQNKTNELFKIIAQAQGFVFEVITREPQFAINDTIPMNIILSGRNLDGQVSINRYYNLGVLKDWFSDGGYGPGTPIKNNIPFNFGDNVPFYKNYSRVYNLNTNKIHWLNKPINKNLFDITYYMGVTPEDDSDFHHSLSLHSDKYKKNFQLSTLVQYKWVDPEKGELYRPLVITPPVMLNVINDIMTFADNSEKELRVVLRAGKDNVKGHFFVEAPSSWAISCVGDDPGQEYFLDEITLDKSRSTSGARFEIAKKGAEKIYIIKIKPSNLSKDNVIKITASINGVEYSKGIKEIKYDHIPIQTLFPEAEIKLIRLDVKKKLKRIGYIPGAGDEVAPCLTQLGYEVIMLTDDVLAKENLSQFEAILTGVRAYNTNEKLPSFKQKLMDYVANGGNLIVQYNTNSWAGPLSSDIGPYKFKITRERITDEEAKVNFELPNHPVLNTPNKITDKDFEGWIQERSIYHAGDWDSNYVAPLSMADPGEKNNKGALIIAKHGKGHFVYSGLVFFRQLPAGVPGAYRLLVNMIELGK
jgi:LmbE family N-acetylglucosaminyl deacetylase